VFGTCYEWRGTESRVESFEESIFLVILLSRSVNLRFSDEAPGISSGFLKRQELANVAWSETRGSLFVGRLGGHCDEFSRSLGLMPTLIDVMLQFDVVGRKSIVSRYKDP
jgi:hypothetical protein